MDTKSHPQIDQAQLGVHEVEVVMQAFAGIRPQEGAMRLLVVPGLVGVAGLHRRDDMHQAGVVAAHRKHLGYDVFLADVALGDVLDGHASGNRPTRRRVRAPDHEAVRQIADNQRSGSAAQKETASFPPHSRPPATCR